MQKDKILLREKYYLDHFEYLISFVKAHYLFLLNPLEAIFIHEFEKLSLDSRCLLARLYNRQGVFFAADQIKYSEILDVKHCLQELTGHGLITPLQGCANVDFLLFLQAKTCQELINAIKYFKISIEKFEKTKPVLIEIIVKSQISPQAFIDFFTKNSPMIMLTFKKEYQTLRFLLFGNMKQTLSKFAVKELRGHEPVIFDKTKYSGLFKSRLEVDECLLVQKAYMDFKSLTGQRAPKATYTWFLAWQEQYKITSDLAKRAYDKLAIKVAGHFEKLKFLEEALSIYATTSLPPSNERRIRINAKLDRFAEALRLSKVLLENSKKTEEVIFASDFIKKYNGEINLKTSSAYLKKSEKLNLVAANAAKPEDAVIEYLNTLNYSAYFSENYLWRGLFGLLLWDVIYDKHATYFHHPFQAVPLDLAQGRFLHTRGNVFEERMAMLKDKASLLQLIRENHGIYAKTENGIVSWRPNLLLIIEKCCALLSDLQLKIILTEMAKDWKNNSVGFPDLFCWREKEYCFIEVKSTFDKLSSHQLKYLLLFKKIGVTAKVIHVNLILK